MEIDVDFKILSETIGVVTYNFIIISQNQLPIFCNHNFLL